MSARLEAALAELAAAIRDEVASASVPDPDAPDRLLSIEEAARYLGVKRTRLYHEMNTGRLRSIKVGRRRLVPTSALSAYTNAEA